MDVVICNAGTSCPGMLVCLPALVRIALTSMLATLVLIHVLLVRFDLDDEFVCMCMCRIFYRK